MRGRLIFAALGIAVWAMMYRSSRRDAAPAPAPEARRPRTVSCPAVREVVDIPASTDRPTLRRQRLILKAALKKDGTIVRLGPGVDLDFSGLPTDSLPLRFGRCVTLTSVTTFDDVAQSPLTAGTIGRRNTNLVAPLATREVRSPRSRGPVLRYGKHRDNSAEVFLDIRCDEADSLASDGVRISGFRLFGPEFGQQSTNDKGVFVFRCVDIEISNMEIAGWGGSGIEIVDEAGEDHPLEPDGTAGTGGRIADPDEIRIHDNFIHHNQHPSKGDHAQGYGINVSHGAWARITQNVFDFNRHSIAAAGDAGGYTAERNLVLKGGGYHGGLGNTYTHSFDVHGTGCLLSENLCGEAGTRLLYVGNAFQFRKDHAIKIRGTPRRLAYIAQNVFPHPGLEDNWGENAINLNSRENIHFGPGNVIDFDSFGQLGVCDFDGDGVDDLFLPTGRTWWFSSFGEFHWTYLSEKTELLAQVRLGYFDDDLRCDVLAQEENRWVISSGGSGEWQSLGAFGPRVSAVAFGRFDPNQQDRRPGATRRTTHAFYRTRTGQWSVTPLSNRDWQPVASSRFPMNELRFGDFTGDGVTDVLAVENGRWAISISARSRWRRLNRGLGDAVENLVIANMDADDNINDILRFELKSRGGAGTPAVSTLTWWRSKNGRGPWQLWKQHVFSFRPSHDVVYPGYGLAGRFGVAPGGGTLVIGPTRSGHFFSQAEIATDWTSVFPY